MKKMYLLSLVLNLPFHLLLAAKHIAAKYSKVSIIRPGHSRLRGFEKKDSTGRLIETFSKNLDQEV